VYDLLVTHDDRRPICTKPTILRMKLDVSDFEGGLSNDYLHVFNIFHSGKVSPQVVWDWADGQTNELLDAGDKANDFDFVLSVCANVIHSPWKWQETMLMSTQEGTFDELKKNLELKSKAAQWNKLIDRLVKYTIEGEDSARAEVGKKKIKAGTISGKYAILRHYPRLAATAFKTVAMLKRKHYGDAMLDSYACLDILKLAEDLVRDSLEESSVMLIAGSRSAMGSKMLAKKIEEILTSEEHVEILKELHKDIKNPIKQAEATSKYVNENIVPLARGLIRAQVKSKVGAFKQHAKRRTRVQQRKAKYEQRVFDTFTDDHEKSFSDVQGEVFGMIVDGISEFIQSCIDKFSEKYYAIIGKTMEAYDSWTSVEKDGYVLWISRAVAFIGAVYFFVNGEYGTGAVMAVVGLATFAPTVKNGVTAMVTEFCSLLDYKHWTGNDTMVKYLVGQQYYVVTDYELDTVPRDFGYNAFEVVSDKYAELGVGQYRIFPRSRTVYLPDEWVSRLPNKISHASCEYLVGLIGRTPYVGGDSDPGFIAPFVALLGTIAGAWTDKKVTSSWLELGKAAAAAMAVGKLAQGTATLVQGGISFVCLSMFDHDPFDVNNSQVGTASRKIINALISYDNQQITGINAEKFYTMYKSAQELYPMVADRMPSHCVREYSQAMSAKVHMYRDAYNYLFTATERVEPVHVLFVGPAGIGKSHTCTSLAKDFCEHIDPSRKFLDTDKWDFNANDKHESTGYRGQRVCNIEEAFASTNQDICMALANTTVKFINTAVFMMTAAGLEEKGNMFFKCNLVTTNTNRQELPPNLLAHPEAYYRRCHVIVLPVSKNGVYRYIINSRWTLDEIKRVDPNAISATNGLYWGPYGKYAGPYWKHEQDRVNGQRHCVLTNYAGLLFAVQLQNKIHEQRFALSKAAREKLKASVDAKASAEKFEELAKGIKAFTPVDSFAPAQDDVEAVVLDMEMPEPDRSNSDLYDGHALDDDDEDPYTDDESPEERRQREISNAYCGAAGERPREPRRRLREKANGEVHGDSFKDPQCKFDQSVVERALHVASFVADLLPEAVKKEEAIQKAYAEGMKLKVPETGFSQKTKIAMVVGLFSAIGAMIALRQYFSTPEGVQAESITYTQAPLGTRIQKKSKPVTASSVVKGDGGPKVFGEAFGGNLKVITDSINGDLAMREYLTVRGRVGKNTVVMDTGGFWIADRAFMTTAHGFVGVDVVDVYIPSIDKSKSVENRSFLAPIDIQINFERDECCFIFGKTLQPRACLKPKKLAPSSIDYSGMNAWFSYMEPKKLTTVLREAPVQGCVSDIRYEKYACPVMWSHLNKGGKGYCGNLYYDDLGRIMGMHCAGAPSDSMSFSIPLDEVWYDAWMSIISEVYNPTPKAAQVDGEASLKIGEGLSVNKEFTPYKEGLTIQVAGTVDKNWAQNFTWNTGYKRSEFYGIYGDLGYAPVRPTQEGFDNALLAYKDVKVDAPFVVREGFEVVEFFDVISEWMFEQCPPMKNITIKTFDEGVRGVKPIKPLALNTAVGGPLKGQKSSLKDGTASKKSDWLRYDAFGEIQVVDPLAREYCDQYFGVLMDGRLPLDAYCVFGKQEVLPRGKNMRTIQAGSMAGVIAGRRLTMDFQIAMMKDPVRSFSSVGLDVHGTDPAALVFDFMMAGIRDIFSGDYQKYDRRLKKLICRTAQLWIVLWHKRSGATEQHQTAVWLIIENAINGFIVYGDVLLKNNFTNPSGFFITTFFNIVCNVFMLATCTIRQALTIPKYNMLEYYPHIRVQYLSTTNELDTKVWSMAYKVLSGTKVKAYGDDHMLGCNQFDLDSAFIADNMMKEFGMTITNTDKNGPPDVKPIEEVSYLSRSLGKVFEHRCPLDVNVVKCISQFMKDDNPGTYESMRNSMEIEGSHLSFEEYEVIRKTFNDSLASRKNRLTMRPYTVVFNARLNDALPPHMAVGGLVASERHEMAMHGTGYVQGESNAWELYTATDNVPIALLTGVACTLAGVVFGLEYAIVVASFSKMFGSLFEMFMIEIGERGDKRIHWFVWLFYAAMMYSHFPRYVFYLGGWYHYLETLNAISVSVVFLTQLPTMAGPIWLKRDILQRFAIRILVVWLSVFLIIGASKILDVDLVRKIDILQFNDEGKVTSSSMMEIGFSEIVKNVAGTHMAVLLTWFAKQMWGDYMFFVVRR